MRKTRGMNKQNLTEGNVEVYKQKDACCRCSVVKNRTDARKQTLLFKSQISKSQPSV